jgi:protein CpxP
VLTSPAWPLGGDSAAVEAGAAAAILARHAGVTVLISRPPTVTTIPREATTAATICSERRQVRASKWKPGVSTRDGDAVMKASLSRAAPLLITTMLVAAPAWAQSTSSQTAPGATSAPSMSQTTAPSQASSAPSGTVHKAMPSSHAAATARQPGETMQSLVERRITDLHSKLHITPAQAQQWDQFAQVMRDNAKDTDQAYQQRAEKIGSMSAVDNMQSYAQIEQQRAQNMQKLVPAFQNLYGSLSDQQKKTADDLFRNYAANAQPRGQAASAR